MLRVERGACHSIFVYDIAFAIDLNQAERLIQSAIRDSIRHKRRAPQYFEYTPAPLRITQGIEPVQIGEGFATDPLAQLVIYDFGAVSVLYRIPLSGDTSRLLSLSESLYENQALLSDSRRRVENLLRVIQSAVSKADVSPFVEDYAIFQVDSFCEPVSIEELTTRYAFEIGRILRAEARDLSPDEVTDAMSHRISFAKDDIAIIDWNAALVVDKEAEDILNVLEFANVELLETRFLDRRLDDALALAYDRVSRRSREWFQFRSHPSDLRDISQWQVDSAILFENVNNVLKLVGDQYLARLYRLAAERFHLPDWDAAILRKLETLERIYQKLADQVVSRRMEVLEWIIIFLFVISIILPFISERSH
jgi:hypothetical protein